MPFIGGMSCNPTLLSRALGKSRVDRAETARHLLDLAATLPGPVFAQTISLDLQGFLDDARLIYGLLKDRVIVKIPCTDHGLRATKTLYDEGISVCQTAVFSVAQAYVSASAGARWVAPYCNRITAAGGDGVATVASMRKCFAQHGLECRLLVASVKSVEEIESVLLTGAEHITAPLALLKQVVAHPLTEAAMTRFTTDLTWT